MIRRYRVALLTAVKADQRIKYAPKSDKVSQTEAQAGLLLLLLVLYRGDGSFMSGVGAGFWLLLIMWSHNA